MPNEPRWLAADAVIALNQEAVRRTSERFLLRDAALLESACANPANRWHYAGESDVLALGVAVMLALARNHPFEQGNKRTAFAAFVAFLDINGYRLTAPDDVWLADLRVAALERQADEGDLVAALAPYVV